MRKSFIINVLFVLVLQTVNLYGQNLGIGPDTFDPDASAGVEIRFTNKGLLIPRLTLAQRNAIASPATSLLIYQTDNTPGYYYNAGTPASPNWVRLATTGLDGSGAATRVAFWSGANTLSSNANLYWDNTNSRLGVGTSTPGSKLEIRGTADLTLRNDQTLSNSGDDLAAINLGDAYSGSQARILVERGAAGSGGDNPTDISFWNTPDGSTILTERMRIMNNGNVGICTTSPQTALHVAPTSTSYLLNDGFEDGTLSPFTTGGSANWAISTTSPYAGSYCAESGTITASQSTYIEITRSLTSNGNLSFAIKVSSESCCDKLKFYIDGTLINSWGGEVPWTLVSFAVSPGSHTFKWEYSKDYSVDSGSDKAWIDDIKISTLNDIVKVDGGNINVIGNGYFSEQVGIGTTSPTTKLQVNGTFGVDIDNNSTSPPHTGYVASTDIAYSRDDISGWTTLHSSGVDEAVSSEQSIGFTFNLFGNDYTTFYVSTNGFIAFGSAPSSAFSNSALPSSTFSMPVICPYWDDMKTTGNGIRTTLLGSSPNRVRIIDFELITYTDSYAVTFQVIMHEKSNLISIRYYLVAAEACGQSATIGIQGPGGSTATAVPISYNAKVLDDNYEPLSISFCPVIY